LFKKELRISSILFRIISYTLNLTVTINDCKYYQHQRNVIIFYVSLLFYSIKNIQLIECIKGPDIYSERKRNYEKNGCCNDDTSNVCKYSEWLYTQL